MNKNKDYIFISDINNILDGLIEHTNTEMDQSIIEDNLNNDSIRRIATERSAIKRIKNILNNYIKEEEQ